MGQVPRFLTRNPLIYILLFYVLACACSIAFFNGTGDSGDSVSHYLFARYAPAHPVLYFDHWAKPLFVLLASPFAQMGFTGMKIFNALLGFFTLILTYRTAVELKLRQAALAPVILLFSPLYYILTFSGLTEPLFALITISGIYLCTKRKFLWACMLISLLPYVRSEGLIIIGVFGLYLLYKRAWKFLPFLFLGSVLFGIAGYFVHGSLLWVFTEIPYAKLSSVYGQGRLLHFVEELINVTGVPVYVLFWLGFIALVVSFFKKGIHTEKHLLLLPGFLCFFIAHSLFWYLGIFNSMGLKRVLIGIMPIIALIALQGIITLYDLLQSRPAIQRLVSILLVAYILIFPFTSNPSAIQWERDLALTVDQKLADKTAAFLLEQKPLTYPLVYNHRYLSLPLKADYFDATVCKAISMRSIEEMFPGNLLVWDNLYGYFESGINKEALDTLPELECLVTYSATEQGKRVVFSVYRKR